MDTFENYRNKLLSSFKEGEKVLVAMSGGVDSSSVAWAAKEAGCKVTGVTLWLYGSGNQFGDAEKIAAQLGIDWHLADYRDFFNEDVISPYINTYKKGETPNPCNLCNRVGKTKYLFDEMKKAGANIIATGHYADIAVYQDRKVIVKSKNFEKDQSYYLSLMDPFHISFMRYPLAELADKNTVRKIAEDANLSVAPKKDSYEACFLEGMDYREFISSKVGGQGRKGDFYLHGKRLGEHKGTFNYTIGQRRGLEISHTEPLYVSNIDPRTGDVTLAEKKYIFQRGVRLKDCIFHPSEKTVFRATAKLRHKMPDAECTVEIHQGHKAILLFDNPQFAPAPGQVAAVYVGDRLLGGGIVENWF